jgi:hypothetical protein
MRLSENRDTRDTAIRRKVMEVNMQEGRTRRFHTPPERFLYVIEFVEPFGSDEID